MLSGPQSSIVVPNTIGDTSNKQLNASCFQKISSSNKSSYGISISKLERIRPQDVVEHWNCLRARNGQ
jgi:hypothetical protein